MALLDLVDPLIGTDSHHGFSTGNCLPLCAVPFGMTAWSPQTSEGNWFFDRRQRKLQGIRATHQPSPWIGDYGHFAVMPQVGKLMVSCHRRSSAFRIERLVVKPHLLKFEFERYRCSVELTPTKRCAHLCFTFPQDGTPRIILEPCAGESSFCIDIQNRAICGFTRGNSGGCPENFACYFYATFSNPIEGSGCFFGEAVELEATNLSGDRAGGFVEFATGCKTVEMKIATSFVSEHQARINLEREIGTTSFVETLERSERVWNETLGRIEIETDDVAAERMFYTCLYRTQLFPRLWHEENQDNKQIHFSPYDGQIHDGPLVADNGFWDTYRTVYPLFALLIPEKLTEILQGWVNALKEGGWFPQWASPGYRACMVGTHIDAVIADAVSRGVTGFEVETAFQGMIKHAFEPGDDDGNFGRIGIDDYKQLGYVAADRHDSSVSRSLDYAYDDFCIANVGKWLGKNGEVAELLERARSYKNLWDASTGFMRARNSDGTFAEPFDPLTWGDPYVEGGAWQSSWAVQQDVAGLIELMGGQARFVEKLARLLAMPPDFNVGSYGFEIHEMTEMACADFGQYAHSNQPVHHVLYLFAAAGHAWLTEYWVRRVMSEMYGPQGFAGDEDNGEMSAWYVLSALGLFPLTPGHGSWVFGTPLFRRVVLTSDSGKRLEVLAPKTSKENVYVHRIEIDGETQNRLWTEHGRLGDSTKIQFEMAPSPKTAVIEDPLRLPPSLSNPSCTL